MMKKKVYIAGPMTGIENYNRDAFNRAAAALEAKGWHPVNPVDLERIWPVVDGDEVVDKAMWGLRAIKLDAAGRADAIYLLKGWEGSPGAQEELATYITRAPIIQRVLLEGDEIPEPLEGDFRLD